MSDRQIHETMGSRWEFNGEVARVFDDMLERSIPDYAGMRDAVYEVARRFARPGTTVLDLGCSRGEAMAPLVRLLGPACSFVGVEVSAPMREAAAARFDGAGDIRILDSDLRYEWPSLPSPASVILSVLTLQFVPINYRHAIVASAYEALATGGCLILVEKVLGASAALDATLVEVYHERKRRNGYTADEVERKRLALEGVLVPVTTRWNEELLTAGGFRQAECFWRWMNFAAWLAVK